MGAAAQTSTSPALIAQIQKPPFAKIGVLDLDSFYPPKERFELAMALNNLLAAPGFAAWMEGEPLDVGALLHTPTGKPRVAIFSIAHLADAERMFFVTLLLNAVARLDARRSRARRACARSSTWTRSSATSRRSRTRRRRRRC